MNIDEIRALVQLLDDSDVAELILKQGDLSLTLRKGVASFPAPLAVPQPAGQFTAPEPRQPAPEAREVQAEKENEHTIVAPMVGTFYRRPAPDAPPYVEVGDIIEVGQPLCIIEAMKLMNEIESEVRGRVKKIMAEDAQPVEYGQPLFAIEPM